MSRVLETLVIEIRAGIHTGECELLHTDIGGSQYTSRRGSSAADAGEILVAALARISARRGCRAGLASMPGS